MKLSGQAVDSLNYPESDLLLCFVYKDQFDYIEGSTLKYIIVDTTFSTNRQKYKLIMFLLLVRTKEQFQYLILLQAQRGQM